MAGEWNQQLVDRYKFVLLLFIYKHQVTRRGASRRIVLPPIQRILLPFDTMVKYDDNYAIATGM